MMNLEILPYQLEFIRPFALAHGTRTGTSLAFVKIEHEGITVYGEASLPPYRKETFESVKKWVESQKEIIRQLIEKDLNKNRNQIPFSSENPAASAALQSALWNFYCMVRKIPLISLFNVTGNSPGLTLTVTKNDFEHFEEKLKLAVHFTHFKLKLTGSDDDFDFVKAFRNKTDIPFCIDFNQGYAEKEEAIGLIGKLEKLNCVLIEQPLKDFDHEGHYWLKQRTGLPVIADESICSYKDLMQYHEAYSGVNIKLMKCGGLIQASQMIDFCREKKIMKLIGCMSESSLGISMAAVLASQCEMADLDSPYLNKNNPFSGFKVQNGKIILSEIFPVF